MFGVTSIFVNLSETMAGFGFLVSFGQELLSTCGKARSVTCLSH